VWGAILGAIVGGVLALVGSMLVELRRDRRRQIGSARLIVGQFLRTAVEIEVLADGQTDWLEGPHRSVSAQEWPDRAHEFVGVLTDAEFRQIDTVAERVRQAGTYGFTEREGVHLPRALDSAREVIERVGRIRRRDRLVWRL
jgi:hypothetical protein